MPALAPLALLLLLPATALAAASARADDWGAPCADGGCAFQAGDGFRRPRVSVRLRGPRGALSDLTPAAGWEILGCDPHWAEGAARVTLRCGGACADLFAGDGAEDTVVRLPDDCGTGPFARVVSARPVSKRALAAVLDYDFRAIRHARGNVSFAISTADALPQEGQLFAAFNETKQWDLPPVSLHKQFDLFNASMDCPGTIGFSAGLDARFNVDVDVTAGFGFSFIGQIVPPEITTMQVFGTLNGGASAILNMDAYATGTLDSGLIQLYQTSLPGMNIPGIIDFAPQFIVHGQLEADLQAEASVTTGVSWSWPNVQVAFPPDADAMSALTSFIETPFKLALDPSASADGTVTAHVIPRLEMDVSVFGGWSTSAVYVALDASAALSAHIDGSFSLRARADDALPEVDDAAGTALTTATPDANLVAARGLTANGCAKLDGGIVISAGSEGWLTGSFDIFKTTIPVFDKCFGVPFAAGALQKSASRRDLLCPDLGFGDLLDVLSF